MSRVDWRVPVNPRATQPKDVTMLPLRKMTRDIERLLTSSTTIGVEARRLVPRTSVLKSFDKIGLSKGLSKALSPIVEQLVWSWGRYEDRLDLLMRAGLEDWTAQDLLRWENTYGPISSRNFPRV